VHIRVCRFHFWILVCPVPFLDVRLQIISCPHRTLCREVVSTTPLKRLDHPHTGGPAHRARGHSAGHRAPIACASAALFRNDANLNNAHPSRAPAAPAAPPHAAAPPLSRIPA
jgi:hypothetical protein